MTDLHHALIAWLRITSHSPPNAVGRDPRGKVLEDRAVEAVAELLKWHGVEVPRG